MNVLGNNGVQYTEKTGFGKFLGGIIFEMKENGMVKISKIKVKTLFKNDTLECSYTFLLHFPEKSV